MRSNLPFKPPMPTTSHSEAFASSSSRRRRSCSASGLVYSRRVSTRTGLVKPNSRIEPASSPPAPPNGCGRSGRMGSGRRGCGARLPAPALPRSPSARISCFPSALPDRPRLPCAAPAPSPGNSAGFSASLRIIAHYPSHCNPDSSAPFPASVRNAPKASRNRRLSDDLALTEADRTHWSCASAEAGPQVEEMTAQSKILLARLLEKT